MLRVVLLYRCRLLCFEAANSILNCLLSTLLPNFSSQAGRGLAVTSDGLVALLGGVITH